MQNKAVSFLLEKIEFISFSFVKKPRLKFLDLSVIPEPLFEIRFAVVIYTL